MKTTFIFITGGVLSSLGKGLAASSIGALMESRGLTISMLKFDPYINVDPGTMNPFQHGEVFVTDDGAETDFDLGHYERYTHAKLSQKGMRISGVSPDNELVEIIEIPDPPWFLGCQFHPEFQSRPWEPHPLFREFISASLETKRR